ncbi:MAG: GFA family protein [Deltaproteobacteria bacterium]|nr:GFA family protein [Deltaproteobacteria bacterium]
MSTSPAVAPPGELRGACHCGLVRVTLPETAAGVVLCHCADCQKLHGGAFALFAADRAAARWEGEEHIRWYASSAANERSFCARCGSRLAKRPVEGSRIMVSAGLFDLTLHRQAIKNLWVEQKPAWTEAPRVGPISPQDFVALALAEPIQSDVAQYGYAMRAASGNPRPPGVIALTWITAADAAERERIRAHSRQNVEDFLAEPGFISIVTGFTGLRGFTVTAWEDEAAMRRALGSHHAEAMKELLGERFVASVWTSVWSPTRINRLWQRCVSCGALEDMSDDHRDCTRCHAPMPERPAFW